MLEDAIAIALEAHRGQVDQAGEPYLLHVLRVMFDTQIAGMDEEAQAAAVLHDVVEDTDKPLSSIYLRFGKRVGELVEALTRGEGEDYESYIRRVIAAGLDAWRIKMIDVMDNLGRMEPIRQADPTKADRLSRKYSLALRLLWDAQEEIYRAT